MPRKSAQAEPGSKFSNRPKGGIKGRRGRARATPSTATVAEKKSASARAASPQRRSSPRRTSPKAPKTETDWKGGPKKPASPKGKRRANAFLAQPQGRRGSVTARANRTREANSSSEKKTERPERTGSSKTLLMKKTSDRKGTQAVSGITRQSDPTPSMRKISEGTATQNDPATMEELKNSPVHLATHLEQISQEMKCFETLIRAPSNPSSNLDEPEPEEADEAAAEDTSAFGKVSKAKSIKELFELLDSRGDGSISEKAFTSNLSGLGFKIPKSKLGRLFKKFSGGAKKFSYRDFGRAIKSHKAKIEAGDGAGVLYELAGMDAKVMRAKAGDNGGSGGNATKPSGPPGADKISLGNVKGNLRPPLRPYVYHHPQVLSAFGRRLSSYIQLHPETDRLMVVIDQLGALCKSVGLTCGELLDELQPVKVKWGLLSAADIQAGGVAKGSVVFKGRRFQRNISWLPDFAKSDSENEDDEAEGEDEITEEEIQILNRCWRGIWVVEAILRQARSTLLTLENLLAYDDTDYIQRRLRTTNDSAEAPGGGPVPAKEIKIRIFELKTRARDMNPGQVSVAAMTYIAEALHFRELAREWLERKFEDTLSPADKKLGLLSYTVGRQDAEMAYTSIRTSRLVPLDVAHGGLHSRPETGDDEKGDSGVGGLPPAIEKASKSDKILRAIPQLVSVAQAARAALKRPETKREKQEGLVAKSREQEEDFVSLLPLFTAEGAICTARERLAELRKAIVATTPMASLPERKVENLGEPDILKANVLLEQILTLLTELQTDR